MDFILGIDIGGTNFRIGLIDENGIICESKIESSGILTLNNAPLENIQKYLSKFIDDNLKEGILHAISIGVPSTVSKDKRTIYSTPNLVGFNNLDICNYLEECFHVPVFLDRDVNFLLMNDIVNKKIDKDGLIVGFYIGTGIGNSIYINGEFLRGKNGASGELGHIPFHKCDDNCGCGNKGCAELYASGKALKDLKDKFYPQIPITDVFLLKSDDEVVKDFIEDLSLPIAAEINILDPDFIVIGGGVTQMDGFPKIYFEKCIFDHTRKPYPAEKLNIIYSEKDIYAGVRGSAYYAQNTKINMHGL